MLSAFVAHAQQSSFFQPAAYGYTKYLGARTFAISDVNGDGKPDLVYASGPGSYCYNTISVALGNGDGTFQDSTCLDSASIVVQAVAVADMNGDGKPDLIAMGPCDTANNCATGNVAVLLGNGDGTFRTAISNTQGITGAALGSIAIGDLDNDGRLDVVATSGTTSGGVLVLLGNGDGTLQPAQGYNPPYAYAGAGQNMTGGFVNAVTLADLNGDGLLDVVLVSSCASNSACGNGAVGFLLGVGKGALQSSSSAAPLIQNAMLTPYGAEAVAVADLNGDGIPDMAVASVGSSGQEGVVSVLLGAGGARSTTAAFLPLVNYDSGGQDVYGVSVVDINKDGKPDVVAYNQYCPTTQSCNSGTVAVLLGASDGTFRAPIITPAPGGGTVMVVADVNGDGVPDAMLNSPQFVVLLGVAPTGTGAPTDGPVPLWALGALGACLAGIGSRRLQRRG